MNSFMVWWTWDGMNFDDPVGFLVISGIVVVGMIGCAAFNKWYSKRKK